MTRASKRESGRGVASDSGSSGAGGDGVVVANGAGDFVTDDGSHYRSKAECLADTDGYIVRLDRDGDGRSAWWQNYCDDYTQLNKVNPEGTDCDDTDPGVAQFS